MVDNEHMTLDPIGGHPLRILIGVFSLITLTLIQGAFATEIYGDLRYGVNSPIRWSYYEVWKNGFLGIATFVTSGTTDGTGHFTATFSGDCNNCWVTIFTRIPGVVDVFCPVQSYGLCAPLPGQSPTHHYSFPGIRVNNGGSAYYGTQHLPGTNLVDEGARIADTILSAWDFVRNQTNVPVTQVSVQFPCGALCPGLVYFNPYVISDVYMKEGVSNDVIIHEYGHAVMFAAYGGPGSVVADIWPVPVDEQLRCLTHSPGKNCGIHVAWTEGWAEFFTSAVLYSTDTYVGAYETPPSDWDPGDWDEGMVAAALWDLFAQDQPWGPRGHFGVGFAPIFNTLWQHNTHSTFRDFYNDFRNAGFEYTWRFNAAAFQNTINYNNPPRIISLNAPAGSATGSALLSVIAADDVGGFVDGLIYSTTFQYSTDGGAHWVSLFAGEDTSYLWVLNFSSPSVIVRARVFDNLGTYSGWTQSAPFSVQPQSLLKLFFPLILRFSP